MTEQTSVLKNTVEAIIFASGEAIERTKIMEALGISSEQLDKYVREIAYDYEQRGGAVELLIMGPTLQFVTKPEYAPAIRTVLDIKKNQPLSSAAFEVLAIVAYNQPVTKSFVEQIRGVDCTGVLNTLCLRGLVEEGGRLDLPGRPLVYQTTHDFLKCFCMSTLAELPEIPDTKAAAAALESIQKDENSIDGQLSIL